MRLALHAAAPRCRRKPAACDTVNVAAGTYVETVVITRTVILRGDGQDSTIIDGGSQNHVLVIAGGTVTIKGVTIQHGAGNAGGGLVNRGTLTVQNCTFSANTAGEVLGCGGGGLVNKATLTVQNSTVADNTATDDGGGLVNKATLTVENSTLSANTAGVEGGGIFNAGTVTLTRVTFENNTPDDCFDSGSGCP